MHDFISEPIQPLKGTWETAPMGRGEPGLPAGFTWRSETRRIVRELERWKQSSPEGGRPGNEVYLRRHCYRLLMDDDSVWEIYFTRQAAKPGPKQPRWFLYTREEPR